VERYSHEVKEGEILYILSLGVLTLKYRLTYIKTFMNSILYHLELNIHKLVIYSFLGNSPASEI